MSKIRKRQILDGSGSGLDADTIDGQHVSALATDAEVAAVHTALEQQLAGKADASHLHNGQYCRWRGMLSLPPETGLAGDVFFNISDLSLYQFDGNVWILLGTVGGHNHDGQYPRWRGAAETAPADPIDGDLWFDLTGDVLKIYISREGYGWMAIGA